MADQNITALPAVTTPESSDQLLLVGATEEKLIDYDKLADAILGKIASKNFALDQGNKTLLQALNELNSKKVFKQSQNGWNTTHTFKGLALLLIVNEVDGNTMYLISQNQSYVIGGYRKNSDLEVTSDKTSSITTIKNPVGGCNMFAISVL